MTLTVEGRPAKVAFLVYNDAENDSRVQKEAYVVNDHGGLARIFAVSRLVSGRGPGTWTINGLSVERLKEFQLIDLLPLPVVEKLREFRDTKQPSLAESLSALGKQLHDAEIENSEETDSVHQEATLPEGSVLEQSAERRSATELVRSGVKELLRRAYGPVRLTDWWVKLVRSVYAYRPDLIHANDANTLVPGILLSKLLDIPLVYDSHELWLHRNIRQDRWLAPYVERLIEKIGVKNADAIITVSPSIAHWLQEEYGLQDVPTLVRNVPKVSGTGSKGLLRERAGLSADDRIISYSGGITTSRGLEEAISALTLLDDSIHLVMMGYGETSFVKSLMECAREKGVGHRVHLVGPVEPDEVAGALADADVALVAIQPSVLSYRFALPNKLFEAIHGRVPVVATNLPDIAEILQDYSAGELFEFGDLRGLAAAIETVINDYHLYSTGVAAAADEFTWDYEAERLVAIYADVIRTVRAEGM